MTLPTFTRWRDHMLLEKHLDIGAIYLLTY